MFKIKNMSHTKRASIYSFDALFAIIIVLSLTIPLLSKISSDSLDSMVLVSRQQKISSLLQISEDFYCDRASKKFSTQLSLDTYSYCGVLSDTFDPTTNYDFTRLGLSDFSVHFTSPPTYSDNHFCIHRQMRDSNSNSVSLWFCAT